MILIRGLSVNTEWHLRKCVGSECQNAGAWFAYLLTSYPRAFSSSTCLLGKPVLCDSDKEGGTNRGVSLSVLSLPLFKRFLLPHQGRNDNTHLSSHCDISTAKVRLNLGII